MDIEKTLAEEIGITQSQAEAMGKLACDVAESGDLEGARQMLETMSLLNPRDSAVAAALGTVYQKLSMVAEADAAYTAAIEVANHTFARVYRGELRLSRGDLSGMDDLDAVIKIDPRCVSLPAQRAKSLIEVRKKVAKKQVATVK
jgi:hypothetical protein